MADFTVGLGPGGNLYFEINEFWENLELLISNQL